MVISTVRHCAILRPNARFVVTRQVTTRAMPAKCGVGSWRRRTRPSGWCAGVHRTPRGAVSCSGIPGLSRDASGALRAGRIALPPTGGQVRDWGRCCAGGAVGHHPDRGLPACVPDDSLFCTGDVPTMSLGLRAARATGPLARSSACSVPHSSVRSCPILADHHPGRTAASPAPTRRSRGLESVQRIGRLQGRGALSGRWLGPAVSSRRLGGGRSGGSALTANLRATVVSTEQRIAVPRLLRRSVACEQHLPLLMH